MHEVFEMMDRLRALETELQDDCGVSRGQAQILIMLAAQPASAGPMTIGDLAAALDRPPGTVTPRVDRMVTKSLVRREPSSTDSRVVHLLLEPKAKLLLPQIREILANCDLSGAGQGRLVR